MSRKQKCAWVIALVVIVVLGVRPGEKSLAAPAVERAAEIASDVIRLYADGSQRGVIQAKSGYDSEIEIVAGPAPDPGTSRLWLEARGREDLGTGIHISSNSTGSGSVSLYIDWEAHLVVVERGVLLPDPDAAVFFGDDQHYLARCGEDLCWYAWGEEVNLTGIQ